MSGRLSGEKLTIYATCQGVFGIGTVVVDLLKIDYSRVRVVKNPMGGRQEAIVKPVTVFMAYSLKRPVKLLLDCRECIVATMARPVIRTKIRTTVSTEGKLKSFIYSSG